jgi:hypothetical protein
VVLPNGKEKPLPVDRLNSASVVFDTSAIPSVLHRLETLATRPERWAVGVRKWLSDQENVDGLLVSLSDRRLYARAVVAAGNHEAADKAGLSDTEITWLMMHAASAAGEHEKAASLAIDLPRDAYPDKVGVLLRSLGHSRWSPSPQQRDELAGFVGAIPGADLVAAAAAIPLQPDELSTLAGTLGLEKDAVESEWLLMLFADAVSASAMEGPDTQQSRSEDRSQSLIRIAQGVGWSLPERLVAARHRFPITVSPQEAGLLSAEMPAVLDDLIDVASISISGELDRVPVEVRARLAATNLTDDELLSVGHEWEIWRRAYASGNALRSEAGSAAARHYGALQALKSGDTSRAGELMFDADGVLAAVVTTLESGQVDARALSDATTWAALGNFIDESHVRQHPEKAGLWHANRALDEVFKWNWKEAIQIGKEALRHTGDEVVRDEVLSLIAFAQFQLGQDEAAMSALERALEGRYGANLQANAGVVAEDMAPERAAIHLGRLAAEAPSLDLRLAAVRRAFSIWSRNRPVWEEEESEVRLPDDLLNAMRSLVVAQIPLDDHRETMRLLAFFDSDWAADPNRTISSPHRNTWDHKLYVARAARDPNKYIEALTAALKERPDVEWLTEERDGFVTSMRNLIFDDMEQVGPAAYAYAAIDAGLPMEPFDRVTLTCGALISICRSLGAERKEPSDAVYDHFSEARRAAGALSPDQQDAVSDLIEAAGNSYGLTVGVSREALLNEGFGFMQKVASQLYGVPRRRVNWMAVTDSLRPLREIADNSVQALDRARTTVRDPKLVEVIDGLRSEFMRLRGLAADPRRAF